MTQNCPECEKAGATTECQYMEFPPGVHHYFQEKVCTFHFWLLYVKPKKGWEEYLKFTTADGASAGYVLTFPPEAVMKEPSGGAARSPPPAPATPPSAGQLAAPTAAQGHSQS